jgi:Arc/MetJ-type ribon-helix-helix transcriptional regulator
MKKTSVYLREEELLQLKQAAEAEGRSQSEVLREAIRLYTSRRNEPPRTFALARSFRGDGRSMADIPEEELFEGFGE